MHLYLVSGNKAMAGSAFYTASFLEDKTQTSQKSKVMSQKMLVLEKMYFCLK